MHSFRLFVRAALAAVVAAGSAFAAVTAAASVTTPIEFMGFAVSPDIISYSNAQVTVSGRLVEDKDPSVGVAMLPVTVEYAPVGTGSAIATVLTDSWGNFTATATLPAGGTIRAISTGDATYGDAMSKAVLVQASPEDAVVTLNPQAGTLVAAGTSLTFTGTAQVSVDGTPEPLAGAPVRLLENGADAASYATTGTDGTFSLPVTAASGGVWQARVDTVYPEDLSLYAESASNGVTVAVAHNTRVESFSVPATREAHSTFTVSGTVQQWNGITWAGAADVMVDIYYRVQPSAVWKQADSAQADSSGAFTAPASVTPGHSIWQARILAQGSPDVYHASSSGTRVSFITDQTCFTGLAAGHLDGRTLVSGSVIDHCGTGAKAQSFGIVKGTAKVYYHPRGTSTWRYLGSARTGAGGSVAYTRNGTLDGYFRIVFPAQGYYLSSTSKTLHLG